MTYTARDEWEKHFSDGENVRLVGGRETVIQRIPAAPVHADHPQYALHAVHALHAPGWEAVAVHTVGLDPAGGTSIGTAGVDPFTDTARTGRRTGLQILDAGAATTLLGGPV
ncbi:hypothetical protein ACWCXC_08070 [Streptomyces sp. NPDC001515]